MVKQALSDTTSGKGSRFPTEPWQHVQTNSDCRTLIVIVPHFFTTCASLAKMLDIKIYKDARHSAKKGRYLVWVDFQLSQRQTLLEQTR